MVGRLKLSVLSCFQKNMAITPRKTNSWPQNNDDYGRQAFPFGFRPLFQGTAGTVFGRVPLFWDSLPGHRSHVWNIYLHEWLIFMVNVGKYTSPVDCMG